jgi:hypothetical protein
MNYCINCKFKDEQSFCIRPQPLIENLVAGMIRVTPRRCVWERAVPKEFGNTCGPEGRYFEAKKINWIQKLLGIKNETM